METDCRLCLERLVSRVVSQGSGMDGQTPEANQQQQQPQQQTNVSQNAQRFASTTNLDASGQGYPVQGCQQGNMPVMQGQGPAWFGAQWIPNNKRLCSSKQRKRVYRVLVVRVCLVEGLEVSKLGSEPWELPRKHAGWPSWSDFGRFDASSSADALF